VLPSTIATVDYHTGGEPFRIVVDSPGIDPGLDGGWAPCRGDQERRRSGFAGAAIYATLPAAQVGLSVTPRAAAGAAEGVHDEC
jgi:hypothetical protein